MRERLRFTLFQIRRAGDPMRLHELDCFARSLGVVRDGIRTFDLLQERFDVSTVATTDVFLFGGAGDFSVAEGSEGPWLEPVLGVLREVHAFGKPTFASCWGFQAMARALGGRVVHDPERAEVGTHRLFLTEAGRRDPLFAGLGASFRAQMGHQDHVVDLPPRTTLLASSERVRHQAYRFDDAPIYCTQFHPELDDQDIRKRFSTYPHYLDDLPGVSREHYERTLVRTPETEALLARFLDVVVERPFDPRRARGVQEHARRRGGELVD